MKKVLLISSLSKDVGIGHLSRLLVIANKLKNKFKITFYVEKSSYTKPDLLNYNFLSVSKSIFFDKLISLQKDSKFDYIIFDINKNLVSNNFINILISLKFNKSKLIAIDGLSDFIDFFDYIFFPSFRSGLNINKSNRKKVIYGWDCFLINPLFKPIIWEKGKNILITTGGSDTSKLYKTLPHILDENIDKNITINWIKGPFSNKPDLTKIKNINLKVINSPSNLDKLMINSNYALTIYGVSFYELIYYGIPTVVFSPYGKKDDFDLNYLRKKEICLVSDSQTNAVHNLNRLIDDKNLCYNLSNNSKQTLNTLGINTFMKKILNYEN